ncbi:SMAD/FHA domain-containing protein [Chloropicon roscoffensis]|uniref:SMAD/FHA domain-containing protein n=1 Tax=Chloropicon roscoffensis TaxID=1461544 RepID=A0AAX4PCC0_9CHLO
MAAMTCVTRATCRAASKATRRQTSAKVVLKPIGDNNADYVIRSGLNQPPQATAITLMAGTSVVGRDEASDLIIPIPTVSGSHAKVEVLGDSVYVTDLKSTNGTFVQDEKIKPETKTEVKVGQSVTFGDSNLASYMVQQEDDA